MRLSASEYPSPDTIKAHQHILPPVYHHGDTKNATRTGRTGHLRDVMQHHPRLCGESPNIIYRIISLYNTTHNRLIKLLELIGFAAIGGTIYSFLGMVDSPYRWYVFGACAGVAMAVIWYRKRLRDRAKKV